MISSNTNQKNILTISDFAFNGCINLESFAAKHSSLNIHSYGFGDCCSLGELKTTIKSIENNGLNNCESLFYLIFSEGAIVNDLSLSDMKLFSGLTFQGNAKITPPLLESILQNGIRISCYKDSDLANLAYDGYDITIINH